MAKKNSGKKTDDGNRQISIIAEYDLGRNSRTTIANNCNPVLVCNNCGVSREACPHYATLKGIAKKTPEYVRFLQKNAIDNNRIMGVQPNTPSAVVEAVTSALKAAEKCKNGIVTLNMNNMTACCHQTC
ncbi:MAG: hypothetical protein IKS08_01000 [Alphaproteobacteria bacterium]|nr:hypothetical protein [Alphaproteobacteria bacterium]